MSIDDSDWEFLMRDCVLASHLAGLIVTVLLSQELAITTGSFKSRLAIFKWYIYDKCMNTLLSAIRNRYATKIDKGKSNL